MHSAGARNSSIWSLVKERRHLFPVSGLGVKKEISSLFSKPSNPIADIVDVMFVVKRGNGEQGGRKED